ncbi:MAG: hypothetical protein HMLKMBBP_02245 [Planctomycetes bacterium]|nr:hypothetical protein [Planctomycetota bacterium]
MSNMGNLEKLGILMIVILVVVVGVVAITPKEKSENLFGPEAPLSVAGEDDVPPLSIDPIAPPAANGSGEMKSSDVTVIVNDHGGNGNGGGAPLPAPGNGGGTQAGTPPAPTPTPTPPTPAPSAVPGFREVKVAKGDTLMIIAKRELGASSKWPTLVEANPGLDPKRMKIGQVIKVPVAAATAANAVPGPAPAPGPTLTPTPAPAPGVVEVPGAGPAPVPTPFPVPTPAPVSARTYKVVAGDTLSDIARRELGSAGKVSMLKEANKDVLKGGDRITVGMTLKIPSSSGTVAQRNDGTTPAPAPLPSTDAPGVYTVKSGDTLSSIASRMLGSSSRWREILAANEAVLHGSERLSVDMKLVIPGDVRAR